MVNVPLWAEKRVKELKSTCATFSCKCRVASAVTEDCTSGSDQPADGHAVTEGLWLPLKTGQFQSVRTSVTSAGCHKNSSKPKRQKGIVLTGVLWIQLPRMPAALSAGKPSFAGGETPGRWMASPTCRCRLLALPACCCAVQRTTTAVFARNYPCKTRLRRGDGLCAPLPRGGVGVSRLLIPQTTNILFRRLSNRSAL